MIAADAGWMLESNGIANDQGGNSLQTEAAYALGRFLYSPTFSYSESDAVGLQPVALVSRIAQLITAQQGKNGHSTLVSDVFQSGCLEEGACIQCDGSHQHRTIAAWAHIGYCIA